MKNRVNKYNRFYSVWVFALNLSNKKGIEFQKHSNPVYGFWIYYQFDHRSSPGFSSQSLIRHD